MEDKYDCVILGTGFVECILSGLLSVSGKKVLHMDRNPYYGGESASLDLLQLYNKLRPEKTDEIKPSDIPEKFGRIKDYSIDIFPKFVMASGFLVDILVHTNVSQSLNFQKVGGSFVYKVDKGIFKVPATPSEALTSSLMGPFQKRYFINILKWAHGYNQNDPNSWAGLNAKEMTMKQIYDYYGLDDNSIDAIGHAIALYSSDEYMSLPALPTVEKMKLYANSLMKFGTSPFIYPMWGLGGLPESFSRLSAIHGGTYMLKRPVDSIEYTDGSVKSVTSKGETVQCPLLIADPTYFSNTNKVLKTGKIARWIFILDHPIPNTNNVDSCQIILPQNQIGRKHDIYIFSISSDHQVVPKNYFLAMISTTVESNNPKKELEPAVKLLGPWLKDFFFICDMLSPTKETILNEPNSNVFISNSLDASTDFSSAITQVKDMYKRITGEDLEKILIKDDKDKTNKNKIPNQNVQPLKTDRLTSSGFRWVPDDEVVVCLECKIRFNLWTRKHHCRRCGRIFCWNCLGAKILSNEKELGEQKVCKECISKI